MAKKRRRAIVLRGARTHNLKNVDVDIPLDRLTVVTGPSGSGKSSLAFDTLFAEGQRRFVESMSTYARQFIQQMPRPDIDAIDNVLPAIAIEQKNSVKNARSTVGTATEVCDFLGLVFGRIGRIVCPECDVEVVAHAPESAARRLGALPEGTRLIVTAPIDLAERNDAEAFEDLRRELMKGGWTRVYLDGRAEDIESLDAERAAGEGALRVVADRLVIKAGASARLTEALEAAFRLAEGQAEVFRADDGDGESFRFSSDLACDRCGRTFAAPRPSMFSFYSPMGACPECEGFGRVIGIDMDKVIPDENLSFNEGVVHPWNTPSNEGMYDWFREVFRGEKFPYDRPFRKLSRKHKDWIVNGAKGFWGVRGYFEFLERKKYKIQNRVMLAKYRSYTRCEACGGARLNEDARCVTVGGWRMNELLALTIEDFEPAARALELTERERATVELVMDELFARVRYLNAVGLGYLSLDRQTRTLSGGEAQRINLATALGSALTGALYVLDEPTVGLHARDTNRLIDVLRRLRDNGNTLVTVEHDPAMIRAADHLIDLGPAAGERGGELIYRGTVKGLARRGRKSLTAQYLKGATGAARERPEPRRPTGWVAVVGAREHNLKNLTVRFPLGTLCCLTGVSGSGKTSLLRDCLYAGYQRGRGKATLDVGAFDRLEGVEAVDDVLLIDQSPLGRSARSNPVTYVKAYDHIRQLFAAAAVAENKKMTPGHFSFNVDKGRCPVCEGTGSVLVDMHFLSDIEMTCETCGGKRFRPEVLEVDYRGRSIDDVLEMTVDQAAEFFAEHAKVTKALAPLRDVGLGYLRLGQRTSTLSGGEAQRLKLAGVLATKSRKRNQLLLFDEPTTGLHPSDIDVLLEALDRLIAAGASVVVIEHNLDFIARADYVIDLGPEGGGAGGEIVFAGPLEDLLDHKDSHTAVYLKEHLSK